MTSLSSPNLSFLLISKEIKLELIQYDIIVFTEPFFFAH